MHDGARHRTFALALGGGGARGFAHIAILEVLDELGVKPVAIAGSSIGAAIGAAYAAGMSGKEMRRYVITLVQNRGEVLRRLMSARAAPGLSGLLTGFGNPMLLDAERFCQGFLPPGLPTEIQALQLPLLIVVADLYGCSETVMTTGPLQRALAASLAVPGLLRPVEIDSRVLVDGAAVNPLPFDCLRGRADVVIAVDTSIGPTVPRGIPDPWEALFSTIQVMGDTIIAEKLKHGAPDLLLRPPVGGFRLLDFPRASAILRAADSIKAEAKVKLVEVLGLGAVSSPLPGGERSEPAR